MVGNFNIKPVCHGLNSEDRQKLAEAGWLAAPRVANRGWGFQSEPFIQKHSTNVSCWLSLN